MAALIPGSKLVVVPQCGHLSTLERPEAVTKALVEWMEA
jgi:pimeloyl-ACP methyl ester carboxylesterase